MPAAGRRAAHAHPGPAGTDPARRDRQPPPAPRPAAVKLAIAAANQIHTHPYSLPAGSAAHPLRAALLACGPRMTAQARSPTSSTRPGCTASCPTSQAASKPGAQPGPGRWITVYANSTHAFVTIAGRAFDTADYGGPNLPTGPGPRWRQNPTGNLADGLAYVARHPAGL